MPERRRGPHRFLLRLNMIRASEGQVADFGPRLLFRSSDFQSERRRGPIVQSRRKVGSPTETSERIGVSIMTGYVYILEDASGKFYVGSTSDVKRRLKQHNNGHTQTTSRMIASKLVLAQEYPSLAIARKVEQKVKKLKRRDYVAKMVKDGYIRIS